MKITPTTTDERVLLALEGRLDASWSETVAAALEEAIRSGRPRIELDLTAVSFISSVGIGVIVRANGRFRAVKGVLAITAASDAVREMLRISKLDFLVQTGAPVAKPAHATTTRFGSGWTGEFESLAPAAERASIEFTRAGTVTLDAGTLALGHFALAGSADDARGHFGEGLAAGGTVAVAPAGAPRPDCLASSPDGKKPDHYVSFIARDAIVARGRPALHGTFERAQGERLHLRAFAAALCEAAGSAVAFVAIGECDGALGAWARVSPDGWARPVSEMSADEMRTHLRFAGEPMHAGESLAVVAIACPRALESTLPAEIRANLVDHGALLLHAHAAIVSYRPVPRSTRDILATGALLAEQPLRAVMHCLHLDPQLEDASGHALETAFVRGSFWAMRIGGAR
jgi:anti-anti-sigma factor